MPDFKGQNSARLLAPVALAVFAVIFFAVILGSGDDEGSQRTTTERQASRKGNGEGKPRERRPRGSTYVVKTGDTLGSISQKTGVPVEQLQERNPGLDAQALVTGQKIKLRE